MIDTALSLLDGPMSGGGLSVSGGDAGPSRASSDGNWLRMNNPFSVAGQGGKANSSASDDTNSQFFIVLALIAGAVLMVMKK